MPAMENPTLTRAEMAAQLGMSEEEFQAQIASAGVRSYDAPPSCARGCRPLQGALAKLMCVNGHQLSAE